MFGIDVVGLWGKQSGRDKGEVWGGGVHYGDANQNQPSYTLQAVRLKFNVYVSGYSAVLPVFNECVSVPRVHSESVCVWPCPQLLYPGAESVRITLTQ